MAEEDSSPLSLITVSDDQCGYCLESGKRRADPRQLPCGHSFCLVCLKNDYERIKAVRCPICRKFLSVDCELDDLPLSSSTERDSSSHNQQMCDSCNSANPAERRAAVKYCRQCQVTFCDQHDKVHSELWSNHKTTSIAEWEEQKPVRDSMMCRDHTGYPVTTGCKVCHASRSFGHEFDVLKSLAQKAREDVQETLTTLQLKKDELCKVEKELIKIIDVLNGARETTLEEIDSAKMKQVKKLNEVIKEYDDMREVYLTRMTEIQTQAERFANQVTMRHTQLDRGIEQGRELHESSLSDADVMRRKEDMMSAADDLAGITVPSFEVKSSFKLAEKGLLGSSDLSSEKELVNIPLSYFFKDMGLNLSLIAVKDVVPKCMIFCHNVTDWGSEEELRNIKAVRFGDYGDSLFFIYCVDDSAYSYLVKISTSGVATREKLRLQFNKISSMKLCGDRVIVMRQSGSPILCSASYGSHGLSSDTKLQNLSFDHPPVASLAVTSSEAILCSSSPRQPKLLAWNPVSGKTRAIEPKFSGPSTVKDMADGPGETVLLFCKQVIDKERNIYQPEQPNALPQNFLALVDISSSNILWQHIFQSSSAKRVMYNQGFFYCLKSGSCCYSTNKHTINVEILSAVTGHTVISELGIDNLPFNVYEVRHANIVQRRDGSRRLMMIHDDGLAVVKFSS